MDWIEKCVVGRSGGMLMLWKSCIITISFSFNGEGYLGICVEWQAIAIL